MPSDERYVDVEGEVDPDKARAMASSQAEVWDGSKLHEAVPEFKKTKCYSFNAEWALVGTDIQVKFFLPDHAKLNSPESRQAWMTYWLERFTSKLDCTAREYFEADRPRLIVKWTEEFQSWWFRASNYDHLLDVGAFLKPFFEKLDQALQEKEDGT